MLGSSTEGCIGHVGTASLPSSLAGAGAAFQGERILSQEWSDEEDGSRKGLLTLQSVQNKQHEHRLGSTKKQ